MFENEIYQKMANNFSHNAKPISDKQENNYPSQNYIFTCVNTYIHI